MPNSPATYTMSTGQAAVLLGVSAQTVQRWADKNLLPCSRSPLGVRKFRPEDVERLAKAIRDGSAA